MQFLLLACSVYLMCASQMQRNRIYGGQRDLLPGETLSLRRAPGSCALSHRHIPLYSGGEYTVKTWATSWKFIMRVHLDVTLQAIKPLAHSY